MGQSVPMSAVTTIEPRRRKFHAPVTLTIPVPKGMQESIKKQKKDENPAVHILYSITGIVDYIASFGFMLSTLV